ncbi:MAG: response regulator transcription factor [Spirochaetaceae bacterium]|nr:MAG: response regulator transcription factor [Spirochaetaceae bacterium]
MNSLDPRQRKSDVLLIEDDPKIVELLSLHLRDSGLSTEAVSSGNRGLKRALESDYKLIILDLMLPGLDGFEICKKIRAADKGIPILMLTAKSEELDKVLGLELGADDYITKPFSIRELLARVKAILRRTDTDNSKRGAAQGKLLSFGDLQIDLEKRIVSISSGKIELTAKEYDLLLLFAGSPGRAFNRQQLLDAVWGYQFEGYQHTVNSHINRLRSKIEADPSEPRYIKTVWGFGYRFAEPDEL